MNAHTTSFIVNGSDFFAAYTDKNAVRIGLVGLPCIDIPKGHHYYEIVANVKTEDEAEEIFDQLIEAGIAYAS